MTTPKPKPTKPPSAPATDIQYTGAQVLEIIETAYRLSGSPILKGFYIGITWASKMVISVEFSASVEKLQAQNRLVYNTQRGVILPGPWIPVLVKLLQAMAAQNKKDQLADDTRRRKEAKEKAAQEAKALAEFETAWVKEHGA